ncbi:hypothetical protein TWF281_005917 [Arthrobotrys megalospora]
MDDSESKQHFLLEYILFMPSPILDALRPYLSTKDIISLTGVCKKWRGYLIPGNINDKIVSKEGIVQSITPQDPMTWHPLLRCINIAPQSFLKQRWALAGMLEFRYSPDKEGGHTDYILYGPVDYDINPAQLLAIFGPSYLSFGITKIHLDGSDVDLMSESKWEWIFQCNNLVEISFRWCSYLKLNYLDAAFVEDMEDVCEGQDGMHHTGTLRTSGSKRKVPPKLKRLWFWGSGHESDLDYISYDDDYDNDGSIVESKLPEIYQECAKRLMERYETDVKWCENEAHHGRQELPERWNIRLYENAKQTCGLCKKVVEGRCIYCDIMNVCDICLGFVCEDCLVVEDAEKGESLISRPLEASDTLRFRV